jgi:hypothetical protein
MRDEKANKPPEVNETGIRLKSGLKKGLLFGAIGLAAALVIGYMTVGVGGVAGAGVIDYLFGSSILKTGGMIGLGIPLAAAGAGFLLGTTDEKPILQAKAEARREWMQDRMENAQDVNLGMAAREQHTESERQRDMLGMGTPGGLPAFSPGMGGNKGRGGGLFNG